MPSISSVRVDKILTNALIGSSNEGFIANDVFPIVNPRNKSGKLARIGDSHYRIDFGQRAPGTPGNRIEFDADQVPFVADEYRLEFPVDDQDVGEYDSPYDAFRDGAMVIDQKLKLKKEQLVASTVTTTGNYAAGHTDTTLRSWDTSGDPIADVETAKNTIISKTGVNESNLHGVCSWNVYSALRKNAIILAHYTSTTPGAANLSQIGRAQVASALGLASLQVGNAVYDTANEGATASMSYVWGSENFAVYYKASATGLMIPNFGYQLFPNVTGFSGAEVMVDRYREEKLSSTVVRGKMLLDQVVTKSTMGFLFTNTLV